MAAVFKTTWRYSEVGLITGFLSKSPHAAFFGKGIVVLIYLLGKILSQKTTPLAQGFEV